MPPCNTNWTEPKPPAAWTRSKYSPVRSTILRMAEQAGPVGADAGRLESGDQRVANEIRPAADPLHAAFDPCDPVAAVSIEELVRLQQPAATTGVRWHDESMIELHRADTNRLEGVRR